MAYPTDQISILSGPAQGVRLIKLANDARVTYFNSIEADGEIELIPKRGKSKIIKAIDLPIANRGTQGKVVIKALKDMKVKESEYSKTE